MKSVLITFLLGIITSAASADVIINEAMINEPGSHTTLEWIELFNAADTTASLDGDTLIVDTDSLGLTGTMVARSYRIICRRLFSSSTTPGFEEYWGNNSGVWGDDTLESYTQPVEWSGMSLTNALGEILMTSSGDTLSRFNWTTSPLDGISLERARSYQDYFLPCESPSGSTPGVKNSLYPFTHDVALTCGMQRDWHYDRYVAGFWISNVGQDTVFDVELRVYFADGPVPEGWDSLINSEHVGTVSPGHTIMYGTTLRLPGAYRRIVAELTPDDRPENNRGYFYAPGSEFPPVILSEVMVSTSPYCSTEWIELANISGDPCDLNDLSLARFVNAGGKKDVISSSLVLKPDEFAVLAEDSSLFRQSYPEFTGLLLQPNEWIGFPDHGGSCYLYYPADTAGSFFHYAPDNHPDGYSYCRDLGRPHPQQWGISSIAGGTPGEPNGVVYVASDSVLSLFVTPRVFSPDGDGVDETVSLVIKSPSASSFSLRIFDRDGRVVREVLNGQSYLAGMYQFDGRDSNGLRLPVGIYIVLFEAETYREGHRELKSTVVIAR